MSRCIRRLLCLMLCMMLALAQVTTLADEAPKSQGASWTVLIYLCGTDLESVNGMATTNLVEISKTLPNENVNVVIETGGTKSWHADSALGLDIATDRIQRYHYDENGFTLDDEQPLNNMAQAETLTDFIKWGQENYPADKYVLTLWDHGGGSMTGLISDEMHGKAVMSLEDMGRAINDAGVHLEALILDTCLMATIETAYVIDDNVNYLIASEEVMPGEGNNYKAWLQYLYDSPECNGARLGRVVCDSVQQKYAEKGVGSADSVTMSVIDLSRMEPVYTAFDNMFTEIGALLADITAFSQFALATSRSESYYKTVMYDLADMANRASSNGLSTETAKAVVNAVDDAVVYSIKGASHSYSHGISFYYAPTDSKSNMDRYARNCFSAPYLAFLDATHMDWTAPATVYESIDRLPEITYEDYSIQVETSVNADGELQLNITNAPNAVSSVDAIIFQQDSETETWHKLGRTYNIGVDVKDGQFVFHSKFDGTWPALNGVLCQMDIVEENSNYTLYGIPCMIGSSQYELRVAYMYKISLDTLFTDLLESYTNALSEDASEEEINAAIVNSMLDTLNGIAADGSDAYAGYYEVYGIWGGGNSALNMPGRDVTSLSNLIGLNMTLLMTNYDMYNQTDLDTVMNGTIKIDKKMTIENKALPAGKYAYSFIVTDVLTRETTTEPVFFYWDGETADFDGSYDMNDIIALLETLADSDDPSGDLENILNSTSETDESTGNTSESSDTADKE